MNKGVIGLNILGDRQFDQNALIDLVQQIQPAYCVVLNNSALAKQLLPYTTVICRFTPDDDAQNSNDGATFVRDRRNSVPSGALLYVGNEPGRSAVAKLNSFTLQAQAEAMDLNLCILNWSTGVPEPSDWDIVAPCVESAVRRGDLIGVHNYYNGDPFGNFSYHWHIGRFEEAQKRFGGNWVITELGYLKLKSSTFPPEMDGGAGWNTDINEAQYAADLARLAAYYANLDVGVCIFSYPDWDGRGFGISNAPTLLKRIGQLNQTQRIREVKAIVTNFPKLPDANVTGWIEQVVSVGTGVRIRETPDIMNGTVRASFSKGDHLFVWNSLPVRYKDTAGFTWIPVRNSAGVVGWSRTDVFTLVDLPAAPPAPPVPAPAPTPAPSPAIDLDALQTQLKAILDRRATIRAMDAQVEIDLQDVLAKLQGQEVKSPAAAGGTF